MSCTGYAPGAVYKQEKTAEAWFLQIIAIVVSNQCTDGSH